MTSTLKVEPTKANGSTRTPAGNVAITELRVLVTTVPFALMIGVSVGNMPIGNVIVSTICPPGRNGMKSPNMFGAKLAAGCVPPAPGWANASVANDGGPGWAASPAWPPPGIAGIPKSGRTRRGAYGEPPQPGAAPGNG